jgi:hypothetical protein
LAWLERVGLIGMDLNKILKRVRFGEIVGGGGGKERADMYYIGLTG